jgi:FkbM family methyltransferase
MVIGKNINKKKGNNLLGFFLKVFSFGKKIYPKKYSVQENLSQKFFKLSNTCQIPRLNVFYKNYFNESKNGCFVEVGAFDGEYVSNTSGLADLGWTGFYIEPIPLYYERCKERHKKNCNIKVSNFAIGSKPGIGEIYIGGPLSTIRNDVRENFEMLDWSNNKFSNKKVLIDVLTLEEYLVKNRISKEFELLVIDVEGYEWEVLKNFRIKEWMPQMVIIELHDQNPDYQILKEECMNIVSYFYDNEYKVIYKDLSNTIYIPKNSNPKFSEE